VVQPEQHVVSKVSEKRILERRLWQSGQQPLLTSDNIRTLGELLQHIEALRGGPQDVEWVWDGRQHWIVQSRPITALASQTTSAVEIVWSNANLKDVMPGLVSPFTWSLMRPQLEAAIRDQFAQVGYKVASDCPVIRRFWGRPYFNFSLFQESAYDLYGASPEQQVAQLGGARVQGYTPVAAPSLWTRIRWLSNALRFSVIADRVRKAAPVRFDEVTLRWQTEIQQAPYLDRAAVLEKLETFAVMTRPFLLQHLHLSWAMSGNFSYLGELIGRWMPRVHTGLIADLVTGIGDISSAEHSYRLWEVSRLARQLPEVMRFLERGEWSAWQTELAATPFAASWEGFLHIFGHRSLYEVEMANPRWREQPDYLFDVLASYVTLNQEDMPFDPQEQARRRYVAECEVLGNLSHWRRLWFRLVLRRVQAFSRLRENSKSHLVKLIDIGRCVALAAAHFLVEDGVLSDSESVFLLEIDEIRAVLRHEKDSQEIAQQITQRRLERQRYAALLPPEVVVGDRPFSEQPLMDQARAFHGLPSSPGRVVGTARVLRLPQEGVRLNPGEILVAPSTDPGWTPLFLLAAGLVMETGGYLSHGAIVAREYGIPAVLNVALATSYIPDGSTVVLDGGEGTVQVVEGQLDQEV
jgi:pyruvate,water dikinase